MEASTATALVLACAESSLPRTAAELLEMAGELGRRADDCGVPKSDLVAAAERLSVADEAGRLDAVTELGRAATALGVQAVTLARACDGFGRLVTAIKLVREGAEVVAQPRGWAERIKALWAGRRERRGTKKLEDLDLEARLLARNPSSSHQGQGAPGGDIRLPSSEQGNNRDSRKSSGSSAMQNCALFGSVTVLPYLGSEAVLMSNLYNELYRRNVAVAFSWLWGLVALGVPWNFSQFRLKRWLSRLITRVGILAATIFVIYFCHWSLAPKSTTTLWACVIFMAVLHILMFIWDCIDGDF
ncbi:hypothetical protein QOZ80_1AG0043110 [Eleusine coracana subsp. coracana]|nr:hypothetical protein QOZ80_1AG0043110 [Eleusine coracana subsp. coracana]